MVSGGVKQFVTDTYPIHTVANHTVCEQDSSIDIQRIFGPHYSVYMSTLTNKTEVSRTNPIRSVPWVDLRHRDCC